MAERPDACKIEAAGKGRAEHGLLIVARKLVNDEARGDPPMKWQEENADRCFPL